MDSGEERLKALGYKQELRRDFTLVSNTAISFSIISTLLGITGKHTLTCLDLRSNFVQVNQGIRHVSPCSLAGPMSSSLGMGCKLFEASYAEQDPCQLHTIMAEHQPLSGDGLLLPE